VHSLKDVPMELPEGFELACVMEREDPRDAWVSPSCAGLEDLPPGAVVGTSSLRRVVLLRAALERLGRHDVRIEPLRGNLDTRLRKLDEGQYAAIVLAAAGLKRLGLESRMRKVFDPAEMLPAAGQGALGIEVRASRPEIAEALAPLAHQPTWLVVAAERAVSRGMGGSCSMPLAAFATWQGEPLASLLRLEAAWGDPDGRVALVRVQAEAAVASLEQAEALGRQVVELLRQGGAAGPAAA
jgi:hydroxymethylbilane synthase